MSGTILDIKGDFFMDIVELGKKYMDSVRTTLGDRYHMTLDENSSCCQFETDESVVRITLSNFSATVQDMTLSTTIHYEFLRCLGEIGTYIKFTKTEDGNLNITHGRCVRDGQDLFAVMAQSASLSDMSADLSADGIISWPYPYFGTTLGETLAALYRKGSFEVRTTDPEYAVGVKPDDIVKTIDDLSAISENKLNVEPSR